MPFFHTLAELFSIVVGVLMLVIVTNTKNLTNNGFLIYLGVGYFWISVLDTFHTFTITGMPFLNIDDHEITIHFWVYTRILEASLLLVAVKYLSQPVDMRKQFVILGMISSVIIWVSFNIPEPQFLVDGKLTIYKLGAELLVISLLTIAIFAYRARRSLFAPNVLQYFYASLILTICAELCFTLYTSFNGIPFVVGHLFKFLSFWMIYKAIVETSLQQPFAMMSRAYESYDAIPHPTILVNSDHSIASVNRAGLNLIGSSQEAIYGKNIHSYFHPQNVATDECSLCAQLKNHEQVDGEIIYYPEYQKWFVYSLAELIQDNKDSGMIQSLTDVTDRQKAEEKLKEQEAELQVLFETTSAGLALCEMDGTLVKVNEAYANIIGRSMDETLNLSYWQITPEKYAEQESEQLTSLEQTGVYGPYIKEYIHKDGHMVPVELKGSLIQQGNETYIWSVVEDISERVQGEERLRRAEKMDAVGQLSGGIAHDFNNILGVILGNIEVIKLKHASGTELEKYLASIEQAGQRAAKLTKQLLDYSRKKADKVEIINLGYLINSMHSLIERSLTPDIDVELSIADDLWLCELSGGDFQDAVLNTIINARDAMRGRGKLTISIKNTYLDKSFCHDYADVEEGDFVELAITDTGVGISEEQLKHIFEPFYTTKDPGKGTGLGLAMVFGFVKRSYGIITCFSKLNQGSTFTMYFPKASGIATEISLEETTRIHKGNNELILVVDDEESLLELSTELLKLLNYQVKATTKPEEALGLLEANKAIDLLLSDIVMPGGMNGYELTEQALQLKPDLKVLLTSGYTTKTVEETRHIEMKYPVLHKPYSKAELAERLNEIFSKA